MPNLINIELLDNKLGGHNDLRFEIVGLLEEKRFDSYYFALAIEPKSGRKEVMNAIGLLFESWRNEIQSLDKGKVIYLPIDFSDQFTGCIKLEKQQDLKLTYGFSRREGWAVDPINPTNFYDSITDFESEGQKFLIVDQKVLENSLNELIYKLRN